ncbi:MAG: transketolase family protein [Candidatus Omnitrophica bacterium]|nr:transketolase family protein [Candidatus Omnitrophota bacterium]
MSGESVYQREVYGKTLVELGRENKNIVVLDADLSGSTRTALFAREFPERFFNFGVAEQNMMAAAAGLASCGKIVFASTFAMFATGRAWDQVRNCICYSNMDVKIVATHAGITVGPDGATHQALEDIALMRVIPNMRVFVPADGPQTRDAVMAALHLPGPVYIRLGRDKVPSHAHPAAFVPGVAETMADGTDIAVFACGIMVRHALEARQTLLQEGIQCAVINIHTIKPIDQAAIILAVQRVKGVVICEEHSVIGGLGGAVEEVLAGCGYPVKIARIGVHSRFGQSGSPADLLKEYRLAPADIAVEARQLLTS